MRTIIAEITARVEIQVEDYLADDAEYILNELDYGFYSPVEGATVMDYNITDFNILNGD